MNLLHALYFLTICLALPAGTIGIVSWRAPDRLKLGLLSRGFSSLAFLTASGAWILRWIASGHLPLFGTYESSLSISVFCLGFGLAWDRIRGDLRAMPSTSLVAAVVLAQGIGYDPTPYALTISERSLVVDAHAVLAWLAFGGCAASFGFALKVLLTPNPRIGLTRAFSMSLSLAFVLQTAMIASGSIYKFMLFGTPWSFDPIETMAFIAWIAYGTILHMNLLAGWTGKKLARWCLGVCAVAFLSYRVIVYFPSWSTYHIFDMDMRTHVIGGEVIE